jgi:hypothetical protein
MAVVVYLAMEQTTKQWIPEENNGTVSILVTQVDRYIFILKLKYLLS